MALSLKIKRKGCIDIEIKTGLVKSEVTLGKKGGSENNRVATAPSILLDAIKLHLGDRQRQSL